MLPNLGRYTEPVSYFTMPQKLYGKCQKQFKPFNLLHGIDDLNMSIYTKIDIV